MTPMCAVACWNVAVQEDKALLGHISPCVPWKHVEAGVAFCVFDFEDSCSRMAPINQANDGHQGKVPTHCQVSLWRRQIDQVWSWRHLVSNCFLCPRLLLLLQQCLPVFVSLCLPDLALEYHPCILRRIDITRSSRLHGQGQ